MPDRDPRFRALVLAFCVVTIAATLAMLTSGVYIASKAADQGEQNGEVLSEVQHLSREVLDCTEQGGTCFKEGQKRTREAVSGINAGTMRIIVAALSCQVDGVTRDRKLAECTVRRAKRIDP